MGNYTISVLICTYNGEKYLAQQICSILEQNVEYEEIIFSDDGSSDNTIELIRSLEKKFSISNFRIINGPRCGVLHNFLTGALRCTSDYLFISDQDDVWLPNRVRLYQELFSKSDEPHIIFSDAVVVDEELALIDNSFINYQGLNHKILEDDSILLTNCVQGASCCINLPLIKELEYIKKNDLLEEIVIHDWLFVLIAKYKGKIDFINMSTINYRQHDANIIGARNKREENKILGYIQNPLLHFKSALVVIRQSYALSSYLGVDLSKVTLSFVEVKKKMIFRLGIILKVNKFFNFSTNSKRGNRD